MLDILKKIAAGQTEFSEKDLPFIGRYFSYFSEKQQTKILEQIWPYIPEDKREDALISGLRRAHINARESESNEALKFLLLKAEEIVGVDFWQSVFSDNDTYEIFTNIVSIGNEESIDLLLDAAMRHCGEGMVQNMLPRAASSFRHKHIVDKFIGLCEERGGDELTQELIQYSDMAIEYLIHPLEAQKSDESILDTALHIIKKQHEIVGPEVVAQSYEHLFENIEGSELDQKKNLILLILQSFIDIGGNELVKAVLSTDNFSVIRYIASLEVDDVTERVEDLAVQTQDQSFIRDVRDALEQGRIAAVLNYPDWIELTLENVKEKDIPEGEYGEVFEAAYKHWARKNIEDADQSNNPHKLSDIIKSMIAFGSYEDLQNLSRLSEAIGRESLYPEALSYFSEAVGDKTNAGMLKSLLAVAQQLREAGYVKDLLAGDEKSCGPFGRMIVGGNIEAIAAYLDVAEQVGDATFVEGLIQGRENDYAALYACNGETVNFLLSKLSPESRNKAYNALHPDWRRLEEKRIPKTAFYQSRAAGLFRWMKIAATEPPHKDLEGYSPYRFKPKLYDSILPLITLACEVEGREYKVREYAYKLSVLFSSEEEIEGYLRKFAKTWGKDNWNVISDACAFEIPNRGEWSAKKWGALLMNYGSAVFPYLEVADVIEVLANEFPTNMQGLKAILPRLNFERRSENPELAELGVQYNMSDQDFDFALNFIQERGKKSDYIPSEFIDGERIGHPDFYMVRLAPDDLMGLFLGHEIDKCCQSINDNGRDCVLYGMSSPYSGFYVWKQKSNGTITEDDAIVAQSWVWIGSDSKFVFDSFERSSSEYNGLARPFIEQFAYEVVNKYSFVDGSDGVMKVIVGVQLGCDKTGQTPELDLQKTDSPSQFINYNGKYLEDGSDAWDSHERYIIAPINHAFIEPSIPANPFPFAEAAREGLPKPKL